MKHIIEAASNSNRVVHYNPLNQTLNLYKLPNRITHGVVHPAETLSLRLAASLSSISIHPKLPAVIAITAKLQTSYVPRGPGEKFSTTSNATPISARTNISLNLYTGYNKELVSTPIVLEFEVSSENKATASPSAWLLKYSRCGNFLVVYTKTFNSLLPTVHQLFVFDVNNKYSYITSATIAFNVEDLEWVCEADSVKLIAACIDGQLRVFTFQQTEKSLKCEQTYNVSSSPICSISYNTSRDVPGLLIGTRDGNTYIMDPETMICTHSNVVNLDLTVLSVCKGPNDIDIITYVNESAHLVRIIDGVPTEIKQLKDLYSDGCGVVCTNSGAVVSVSKEGVLKLNSMYLTLKNMETNIKSEATDAKLSTDLLDPNTKERKGNEKNENKRKKKKESHGLHREYWGKRPRLQR